jgi:maltooligosyltrehalose trehalohydrolase
MAPSDLKPVARRFPIGGEPAAGGAHFRVWAPDHSHVHLVVVDPAGAAIREVALEAEADGYFAGAVPGLTAGARYGYRLGSGDLLPDPASRFQPDGPHGPSQLVDASAFRWTDHAWPGATLGGQVLYELHVGTFTPEGTWRAAMERLAPLAELGITGIEIMPVADFAGKHGWGYDGVNLFAPSRLYGTPDDMRAFVDRAHALGLAIILDVVYNHFGPDGNYLGRFASAYFATRHANEWGDAINFDGDHAAPVRELIISNAAYWIGEFHLDGLRLDATQQIFDDSPVHLVTEIARAARQAAGTRSIMVVAENEPQDTGLLAPQDRGGNGLDALWNDDFHHAALVALTGRREAYYTDYLGSPQEFISLVKYGFLYQGQRYSWQRARRGAPSLGIAPERFITFLENHDQVANDPSGCGHRLREMTDPGCYRAMTAYWLLAPGTPMFFQGQERGSTTPFRYFTDHRGELAAAVRRGRAEFLSQFRSTPDDLVDKLPDPSDPLTFTDCRLTDEINEPVAALHRDLLRLRRHDLVFTLQRPDCIEGSVLGPQTFVLRYFPAPLFGSDAGRRVQDDERLVVVNFGIDLHLDPAPHPLLAPPAGTRWRIHWSSEDPGYGGRGTAPLDTDDNWLIPGRATVVLAPESR